MRPLRLEIEGFTSFRDRVALDLAGLDLFAITGPTGAGKSSIIDAMVFALYGQVPRVSREYRQLVSHGAERLSAQLDFQVGGERYRVARTARPTGGTQVRLDRLVNGHTESLAGRVKELDEQIQRIVGLDYDAFTRSVVLPQGQFDVFLKGKPEERRKILVALLNLGVYETMHGIVNARAAEARRESQFIASQLERDYKGATPEALAAVSRELREAERQQRAEERASETLACALKTAQVVRDTRRDLENVTRELASAETRAVELRAAREEAAAARAGLAEQLEALESRLAPGLDEARLLALAAAIPRAEQLIALKPRLARLARDGAERATALEKVSAQRSRAARERPRAEAALRAAREAAVAAREHLDEMRRRHAAHALRSMIAPGEPCPVCERPISRLRKEAAPALESAQAASAAAEAEVELARGRCERLATDLEVLARQEDVLRAEHDRLEGDRDEAAVQVRGLEVGLREAGVVDAAADGVLDALRRERAALETTRAERDALQARRHAVEAIRARLETALADARGEERAASARIEELRTRHAVLASELERERRTLLQEAAREGWDGLESPPRGLDEVALLETRRQELQRRRTQLAAAAARLAVEAQALEEKIARARELLSEKARLDASGALASTLAQHLQANQFIAYVQEEALRVLAEDGSRHLHTLSQGRYSLTCESQEFSVIDHWNADVVRSVKTLSGGESFLASLALALALAERLAELSAEGRAVRSLESLFLDEGFGSLDAETLDVVVQGIEALQGGHRMVGVVTHLPDLAERLPARVEVSRGATGACLAVS